MVKRIIDVIASCNVFLLTSHVRLDGDAIGSELALYHVLRSMGKKAVIYNQDDIPVNYRFLPGVDLVVNSLPDVRVFDAAFILDCSELERVGEGASDIRTIPVIVNIDHHVSNESFCEISLIDPEASSTGELIFRILNEMKYPITEDVATSLYTAVMTDTGSFRYSNTSRSTFLMAGELVSMGAVPHLIAEKIYETVPVAKIRLLARALETLEFAWDGKISSIVVTRKMLEDADALPENADNFAEFIRSMEGVQVAVFYTELSTNLFKVSFRSKGVVDVEKVAKQFGGGGHSNASACKIAGDLTTVKKEVIGSIIASGYERDRANP
ncbi:MAG: bifunctional oligoribonuclease/PAP phosphatase NrnA [Syntrophales bacterium]